MGPILYFYYCLCFLAIDKAAILVIAFGLYKLFTLRKEELLRKPTVRSQNVIYILTVVLGVTWFLFTLKIGSVFNPNNIYVSGSSDYWSVLGAKNILDIPVQVILHPSAAINALSYDWVAKLSFLAILLGPFLFLLLLAPRSIILLIPWLTISLLSNNSPYYQFGTQYPAFILPAVVYGSIMGANNIVQRLKKPKIFGRLNRKLLFGLVGVSLLASAIGFQLYSGPFVTNGVGRYPSITYGFPNPTPQSMFVSKVLELVPKDASILTQNNIFPLVSNRANAYVTPMSVYYVPGTYLCFRSNRSYWKSRLHPSRLKFIRRRNRTFSASRKGRLWFARFWREHCFAEKRTHRWTCDVYPR